VWFGEAVPLIDVAAEKVSAADRLIIVGTSLQVYPAAGLVHYAPVGCPVHLIDPRPAVMELRAVDLEVISEKASTGMPMLADRLLSRSD
jgi:NAD-dependent deacetylase